MNKRLEEILQRKEEIRSLLADETNKNLNFDELEKEVREFDKEEKEISTITSEWVKARNTVFPALIDSVNNKILDEIEKSIKK